MPAWNAGTGILTAVSSVQAQSISDWELVIVDDGSTDNTRELLADAESQDARIRVLTQDHGGAAQARNKGAEAATADLLVFLDADDRLQPDYLETMARAAESMPEVGIFACNAWNEYADGTRQRAYRGLGGGGMLEIHLADLIRGPEIPVYSTVRRVAFQRAGGFTNVYAEDYDLWLRLLAMGVRAVRIDATLVTYDARGTGKSAAREQQLGSVKGSLEMLMRELPAGHENAPLLRTRIAQLDAEASLLSVKRSIRAGDSRGARRSFIANRRAYRGPRGWLTLALVLVSPRLYGALSKRADPNSKRA